MGFKLKRFTLRMILKSFLAIVLLILLLPAPGFPEEVEAKVESDSDSLIIHRPGLVNVYNPSIHHRRPAKKFNENLSFTVQMDFLSQYVWRGIPASQGWVWQPSLTFEAYGVGVSVWGNFVLDDEPNQGEFNEIDFTLYYHHKFFKKLDVNAWFIFDVYPDGNPQSLDEGKHSLEANLHIAYPVGPIDLFTHLAVRIISAQGAIWWDMGVGYQHDLPLNFGVQTSVLFAVADTRFNKAHFGVSGFKANQFLYSLAFPWTPIKGLHFAPTLRISVILADSLRKVALDPTLVYGGLSIYYNL